ncbi:MAG TPA: rRNA maturation RNase YbeY [Burkholderiales bacterium]|nr:rRNA maturation RNase YbeY [Burkholderiales bacterium]
MRRTKVRAPTLAVQYAVSRKGLPAANSFRLWASAALERSAAQITIRLVNAREGRALNRAYRGKDYPTNILSFVYELPELSGDLVLCAPVITKEARAQGKRLRDHYAHLIVHGTLHLQGWDHQSSRSASKMERREIAILATLGIADPYVIETPEQ